MRFRVLGSFAAVALAALTFALAAAQNVPPTPPPPLPPGAGTPSPGVQVPAPTGTLPSILTPEPLATPTPPPPTPTPSARGRRRPAPESSSSASSSTPRPRGSPPETPAPPQFSTLDGVWEIELQTPHKTYYSHIYLTQGGQGGSDVTGTWDDGTKKWPLTGTFDGRLFTFTVNEATKHYTLSGYIENFSDMVGLLTDGATQNAFTAEHRKKEKRLDISPAAGGGGRF